MIGKYHIEISGADLIKGMSTSADIADGGFSPETDAVNLTYNPGVLYAPAAAIDSDTDTRLTGNIIATSPDMVQTSPDNRLLVTDDGKGYRYNGTKITAAGVALTAAKTWTKGFTDIITFGGEAYVTSKESITRWESNDTIDGGADFPFAFTTSNVPHPALVYENNAYYADKNLLKIQSAVGVAPTTVLTLSADQIIMSLGIDPGTGLMLISTTNALNVSNTVTSVNKLMWYDGNSAKISKSVIVDDMILGFRSVGGTTFVGYSNNIGYINGSGITFLRKLKNVTLSSAELPYKHNLANIGSTFYVLDGLQVLAYGDILPGQKRFYYAFKNNTNSNKPTVLADVGSGKLGIGFATTKFYTFDTTSVASTNTMSAYSNKYLFPRPVYLRSAYVEYADSVANNDDNRSLYYQTQADGISILRVQGTTTGGGLKNSSGAGVNFIGDVIGFTNNKANWIQLRYNSSTTNYGVRRVIIYYDNAE